MVIIHDVHCLAVDLELAGRISDAERRARNTVQHAGCDGHTPPPPRSTMWPARALSGPAPPFAGTPRTAPSRPAAAGPVQPGLGPPAPGHPQPWPTRASCCTCTPRDASLLPLGPVSIPPGPTLLPAGQAFPHFPDRREPGSPEPRAHLRPPSPQTPGRRVRRSGRNWTGPTACKRPAPSTQHAAGSWAGSCHRRRASCG